jgi:hypothetical protein
VFGVSVVGAGIFTITASTAGNITGPAISISYLFAALACGLAALCYAEFASTLPVAGSAYTFSYARFGELIAWVIGWDLILEFAVGAAVVAESWSNYLGTVFGFSGGTTGLGSLTLDWGELLIIGILTVLLAMGTNLSANVSAAITAINSTTGLDGKVNPKPRPKPPPSKPRRRPLVDAFREAVFKLKADASRIGRLAADDRVERNREQLARSRFDLMCARTVLDEAIAFIDGTNLNGTA